MSFDEREAPNPRDLRSKRLNIIEGTGPVVVNHKVLLNFERDERGSPVLAVYHGRIVQSGQEVPTEEIVRVALKIDSQGRGLVMLPDGICILSRTIRGRSIHAEIASERRLVYSIHRGVDNPKDFLGRIRAKRPT